jgi:hypothetical protein
MDSLIYLPREMLEPWREVLVNTPRILGESSHCSLNLYPKALNIVPLNGIPLEPRLFVQAFL